MNVDCWVIEILLGDVLVFCLDGFIKGVSEIEIVDMLV